jgi:SAM-dependent methyltransferase
MASLHDVLRRRFASDERITMLDAGCGKQLRLEPPVPAHVVGIDAAAEELAANPDVDERIVGDLATYPFEAATYDLVVCWDVLEHLPRPERAIDNLVRAVKPNGLLVIKVPNVLSVKGVVTKWMPTRLRRVIVRRMLPGLPDDYKPFPSFHRFSLAPRSLRTQLETSGLSVLFSGLYEADMQRRARQKRGLAGLPWRLLEALARLSGGRIALEPTEFVLVAAAPQRRLPPAYGPASPGIG